MQTIIRFDPLVFYMAQHICPPPIGESGRPQVGSYKGGYINECIHYHKNKNVQDDDAEDESINSVDSNNKNKSRRHKHCNTTPPMMGLPTGRLAPQVGCGVLTGKEKLFPSRMTMNLLGTKNFWPFG